MNYTQEVVETSMSALGTFQRCRKRFRYSEVLGWMPKSVPTVMEVGTLYHAALAAGVRTLVHMPPDGAFNTAFFVDTAVGVAYSLEVDRNGMKLNLDQGDREMVEDMVRYSFEHFWKAEIAKWDRILAVEEPAYIQIGRYLIRNTFDLVVKYRMDVEPEGDVVLAGRSVVLDAKTVDDPRTSRDWIPLDFQTRSYPLAARGRWQQPFPFKHVFVAREVPPGFGHRPITTETGKARPKATLERMSMPENYVQSVVTDFNDHQLDHFERKMVGVIMEIAQAEVNASYPESPIKVGPFSCGGCPYYAPCTFEMDGNPEQFQPMLYIQRGSPEWQALQTAVAS